MFQLFPLFLRMIPNIDVIPLWMSCERIQLFEHFLIWGIHIFVELLY